MKESPPRQRLKIRDEAEYRTFDIINFEEPHLFNCTLSFEAEITTKGGEEKYTI